MIKLISHPDVREHICESLTEIQRSACASMLRCQLHRMNIAISYVKKQLCSKITIASTSTALKSMLQKLVLKGKIKKY